MEEPLDRSPFRPTWLGFSSATLTQRLFAVEGLLAAEAAAAERSVWGRVGVLD